MVLPPLVVLKVRHIVQSKLLSAAFSMSSSEWRLWHDAWNHLRTQKKTVLIRTSYFRKIGREWSSRADRFVEKLHTCHTGGTARWLCLRCSPPSKLGMLKGWHREHTGYNYSATHTLGLGWWHRTAYRTHTCRRQEGQRSFNPGYLKRDNTVVSVLQNPFSSLHCLHDANMKIFSLFPSQSINTCCFFVYLITYTIFKQT